MTTVARADAVRSVLDATNDLTGRAVILLDGGSGAGKTVLAGEIADAWARTDREPLQVVHLDDVYPGWYGLAAASEAVVRTILRDADPGYRRWDWVHNVPTDWVPLDPYAPVLVEGCGALTPGAAPLAGVRVWVDLDAPTRRRRALARSADFEPWWDVWAAQEQEHWQRNRPWELATLRVRG